MVSVSGAHVHVHNQHMVLLSYRGRKSDFYLVFNSLYVSVCRSKINIAQSVVHIHVY